MIKDACGLSTLRYAVKYKKKSRRERRWLPYDPGRFGCFRYYASFAIMGRTCPQGFG
jgi:hypothetical protein